MFSVCVYVEGWGSGVGAVELFESKTLEIRYT